MRAFLLASVAAVIANGYHDETVEVVLISTANGPVRLNKSTYDADPDKYQLHGVTEAVEATDTNPGKPAQGEPTIEPAGVQAQAGTVDTAIPGGAAVPPAPSTPGYLLTPSPAPQQAPGVPTVPAPGAWLAQEKGSGTKKRYFIVRQDSSAVEYPGIDPEGYKTQNEAFDAILKIKPAADAEGKA